MSNPFLEPTNIYMYMYTLQPTRLAITTEGLTETEAAIVARHWAHLQDLTARGVLIFGDRTLITTEHCFASVVFRADSEEEARGIMEGDPGGSGRDLPRPPVPLPGDVDGGLLAGGRTASSLTTRHSGTQLSRSQAFNRRSSPAVVAGVLVVGRH